MMASQAGKPQPSSPQWAQHELKIRQLYLEENKGQNEVIDILAKEYGFCVTKSQLGTQLKKWGIAKNHKRQHWVVIADHLRRRQAAGKQTEVFFKGRIVPGLTVQRETMRHRRIAPSSEQSLIATMPPGFRLHTPPPEQVIEHSASSAIETPLTMRGPLLPTLIEPQQLIQPGAFTVSYDDISTPSHFQNHAPVWYSDLDVNKMSAMFPSWYRPATIMSSLGSAREDWVRPVREVRFTDSQYMKDFVFLVANGHCRIEPPDIDTFTEVWTYLKSEAGAGLFDGLLSVLHLFHSSSIAAVTANFFQCTIERGDAGEINSFLRITGIHLELNKPICYDVFGQKRTPIELASMYWHKNVIKILIHHNCEVNKSPTSNERSRSRIHGALQCAMSSFHDLKDSRGSQKLEEIRDLSSIGVLPDIVKLLLGAGARVDPDIYDVNNMIAGSPAAYELLLRATSTQQHAENFKKGVWTKILQCMDDETSVRIFRHILSRPDADRLIYGQGNFKKLCKDLLLETIKLKYLGLLQLLLGAGKFPFDPRSILDSIKARDLELVQLLAMHGTHYGKSGILSTAPVLIAAIRAQDPTILQLVEDAGAWSNLTRERSEEALLAAFVENDFVSAERLLNWQRENGRPGDDLFGTPGLKPHNTARNFGLLAAARAGRLQLSLNLIEEGANINFSPYDQPGQRFSMHEMETALGNALRAKSTELVHAFLDNPDIDLQKSPSILLLAIEWGDQAIIKTLIRSGVPTTSEKAMQAAIDRHDHYTVELLLEEGNSLQLPRLLHPNVLTIEESALVEGILSTNTPPTRGHSSLAMAVLHGNIAMAAFLLSRGADPADTTALSILANREQSKDMTKLVLSYFRIRYPQGECLFALEAMCSAVTMGDGVAVREFLAADIRFPRLWWTQHDEETCRNSNISSWKTPLAHAIQMGGEESIAMMRILVEDNFDPEAIIARSPSRGLPGGFLVETALLVAIGSPGHRAAKVTLLVEAGADINAQPARGVKRTPLQKAAERGDAELVDLLINLGADVNAPAGGNFGGTALLFASQVGLAGIVERLLREGADPNTKCSDGRTALSEAAALGRLDTVKLLLQFGVKTSGPDYEWALRRARNVLDRPATFDLLMSHRSPNPETAQEVAIDSIGNPANRISDFNLDEFITQDSIL